MTLSRFLRDYLYIPLGGNRHGAGAALRQPARSPCCSAASGTARAGPSSSGARCTALYLIIAHLWSQAGLKLKTFVGKTAAPFAGWAHDAVRRDRRLGVLPRDHDRWRSRHAGRHGGRERRGCECARAPSSPIRGSGASARRSSWRFAAVALPNSMWMVRQAEQLLDRKPPRRRRWAPARWRASASVRRPHLHRSAE